jgi:FecCD transport family
MVHYFADGLVGILLHFTDITQIRAYEAWNDGTFGSTTWGQVWILAAVVGCGLAISGGMAKSLNALLMGDHYARTLGVFRTSHSRTGIGRDGCTRRYRDRILWTGHFPWRRRSAHLSRSVQDIGPSHFGPRDPSCRITAGPGSGSCDTSSLAKTYSSSELGERFDRRSSRRLGIAALPTDRG